MFFDSLQIELHTGFFVFNVWEDNISPFNFILLKQLFKTEKCLWKMSSVRKFFK